MDLSVAQIKQKNISLSHSSCIPSVIVLIVNLTRSRITWEELTNEGWSRLGFFLKDCLHCVN